MKKLPCCNKYSKNYNNNCRSILSKTNNLGVFAKSSKIRNYFVYFYEYDYEKIFGNIFKYLTRRENDGDEYLSLIDIHYINMVPLDNSFPYKERINELNILLVVDLTDKVNYNLEWDIDNNIGSKLDGNGYRGTIIINRETERTNEFKVSIYTLEKNKNWAENTLYFIKNGDYPEI